MNAAAAAVIANREGYVEALKDDAFDEGPLTSNAMSSVSFEVIYVRLWYVYRAKSQLSPPSILVYSMCLTHILRLRHQTLYCL